MLEIDPSGDRMGDSGLITGVSSGIDVLPPSHQIKMNSHDHPPPHYSSTSASTESMAITTPFLYFLLCPVNIESLNNPSLSAVIVPPGRGNENISFII